VFRLAPKTVTAQDCQENPPASFAGIAVSTHEFPKIGCTSLLYAGSRLPLAT